MINATEIRNGMMIKHDGDLYVVVGFHHLTPGNKRGLIQARLKNLKQGNVIQSRFRVTDKIDKVFMDYRTMEYLYHDGSNYCMMDTETLEQEFLPGSVLDDYALYMSLNSKVRVGFYEGRPVSVELPAAVELKVTETSPGTKGDTVTNAFKPAKLETGLEIKVPMFINEGDVLKVDTRSGEFLSRA
ncbi:MAG: elongation factor P [Candidatus Brocadiales bacterium]|nr:elongation factor P [Candidatus Bathyanammoxibius sp.]MCQ4573663.1 elongation factor P [Candidatus Bathyanammoxibius amoris]